MHMPLSCALTADAHFLMCLRTLLTLCLLTCMQLCDALLEAAYLPKLPLGALQGLPGLREAAAAKLLRRQAAARDALLHSVGELQRIAQV